MGNLLSSLSKTIHASLAIAIILFLGLFYQNDGFSFDRIFWSWVARYVHVIVGIMWIGCLLYTSPSPRDVEESRMPSSA